MSSATRPLPEAPRHPIPVRDPDLDFDASIPNHWLGGSPLATHFFNGLNLVFPDGERFFIRAVKDHLPRVRDPELREQVKGFFGQEAHHAAEHERYFDVLRAQGYRIDGFLRRFRAFSRFTNRWLPAPLRLAMTAGAEHYTAAFGVLALEDDELLQRAHPTMRRLILWHATEEIEHKAVAFDVLKEVHPSYVLRVLGFALATLILFGWTIAATRMLLRQDGFSRAEVAAQREQVRRVTGGGREERLGRAAREYLRRDFHPGQVDDLPLARRRLAELGLEVPA